MDVKQSATSSLSANARSYPVLCSTEYGSTDSSPAGEHGSSCADNQDNPVDDVVVLVDSGSQEAADIAETQCLSVRPTSPDLNCPICLGRLENRSYTDTCFHKFCFVCLVEWSKVKPVCPLCKQPFTSVIHNVQSYENFEQLPITSTSSTTAAVVDSISSRFRYPTTVIRGSSERRRQRDMLQRPSRLRRRGSSRFDVPPPAFTSSFRRSLYRDELWARNVEDSGRCRDASAAFFTQNPAAVHRLMPWLNRELMALLRNPSDVMFLLEVILTTVTRVDITSETFYDLVAPFLGARTRHFVHEFHTFARSPFNMEAYDTRVAYERPRQMASSAPIEFSDTSSSNSSDAEIVEVDPLVAADDAVDDNDHVRNESIFSLEESMENVNRNTSSPQPGPSYVQDIALPGPSRLLFLSPAQNISVLQSFQHSTSLSLGGQDMNTNEDSDNNVEIVAEDKPWQDRSPVVLSSSDSEADNDIEHEIEPLNQISNISSRVDTSQEMFPIFQQSTVGTASSEYDVAELVHSDEQINTSEITVTDFVSGSDRCAKKSPHHSKHHHKRTKKHKHSHHRDSSHRKHSYEHHSSSSGHHKKHEHRSRKFRPSDSVVVDSGTKNKQSPSVNNTDRVSDSLDNQVWMSDDSSDSTDHQPLRSVVVVPQTFKKNSTGHKRSRDSS